MASYSRINSSTLSFSGDTVTNKNTGIYVGVLNQKTHSYEGQYNNAEKTITYSEDNTTYTTNKPNWLELKLSDTIDNNTASELLITLNGNTNAERTCYIKLSQNSTDYLKIVQNYTKGIKIWNLCPKDISLNNKAIFISFRYNFNSSIMDEYDSGKYSCTFSLFKHNDSNITIKKDEYVLFKEVTENLYYLPDSYSLKTIFSNSSNSSTRIIFDSSINFSINQLSMYDTTSEDTSIKNKSLNYLTRGCDTVVAGGGLYFNKIQYYLSLADTTNSAINIVNYGDAVFDDDSIDGLPTGLTFNSSSYINYNYNFNEQRYEWLNKSLFDIKNIGIKPINYEYGDIYKYINIIFNRDYFITNSQFVGHNLYLVCIRKENSKASFKIYRSYHTILNSYSKPFVQIVFEIVKIKNASTAAGWPNEDGYLEIKDSSALNFYKGMFGNAQVNNIETLYTNNNYQENAYNWRLFEDTYTYNNEASFVNKNNVSIYQSYNNIKLLPYTQQLNHKLLDTIPNCSSYITYTNDGKFALTQLDGQIGLENPSTFDNQKLTININNNKGAILYWQQQ